AGGEPGKGGGSWPPPGAAALALSDAAARALPWLLMRFAAAVDRSRAWAATDANSAMRVAMRSSKAHAATAGPGQGGQGTTAPGAGVELAPDVQALAAAEFHMLVALCCLATKQLALAFDGQAGRSCIDPLLINLNAARLLRGIAELLGCAKI
ncbi:hypothetical protein HaLaN_16343, partial [Haematococcus lacustris]